MLEISCSALLRAKKKNKLDDNGILAVGRHADGTKAGGWHFHANELTERAFRTTPRFLLSKKESQQRIDSFSGSAPHRVGFRRPVVTSCLRPVQLRALHSVHP